MFILDTVAFVSPSTAHHEGPIKTALHRSCKVNFSIIFLRSEFVQDILSFKQCGRRSSNKLTPAVYRSASLFFSRLEAAAAALPAAPQTKVLPYN